VRHNNFRFTIKFVIPDNWDRGFINEYIKLCCDGMYQNSTEPKDVLTSYLRPNVYVSYLELTVKDYGVPEVGVDLVTAWIEQLYKHCDGFVIDVVIVHPKTDPPARGAVIKWDYVNNCPIVQVITK
jgi:hypothetical protein